MWTCGHRGGNCKYPEVRFDEFMDVSMKLLRFSRPAPTATVTAVKLSREVMSGEAEEGKDKM